VVIAELARRGAAVRAYDPVAMPEAKHLLEGTPRLAFAGSQQEALEGADALVIVTEWKEFRNPDFDHIKATLKAPVIFDGRNLYEPGLMKSFGIEYAAVGRPVA
jgi:UDPglucose 6-dehydrogenase